MKKHWRRWTQEELEQIKRAEGVLSISEIAVLLGRSYNSVLYKARNLDLEIAGREVLHDFSTCKNQDCSNPNNGSLTETDYHKRNKKYKHDRGRDYLCGQCRNVEQKRARERRNNGIEKQSIDEAVSRVDSFPMIQQWLCGRL